MCIRDRSTNLPIQRFAFDAVTYAVTARDLNGAVNNVLRHLCGKCLCDRRLTRDAYGAAVLGPRRSVDKQSRCVYLDCTFRERCLCHLQIGERPAEQLAGCGTIDRFVECTSREPECRRGDRRNLIKQKETETNKVTAAIGGLFAK